MRLKKILVAVAATAVLVGAPASAFAGDKQTSVQKPCDIKPCSHKKR